MTPSQLKRIHIALDQCGGRVKDAAVILGVPTRHLNEVIAEYPELQSYSEDCKPPSEEEAFYGPPVRPDDMENALARADKASIEERKLTKSLTELGISPSQMSEVMGFYKFGRDQFHTLRHSATGGIASSLFATLAYQKELIKDIADAKASGDVERESMLREDYGRIVNAINSTYDRVLNAYRLNLSVEAAKMAAKNGDKRKGKPAFPPLAIQVNGGDVSVTSGQPVQDAGSEAAA